MAKRKMCSRSPRGERGLKSRLHPLELASSKSLSSRRAWIEIIEEQKKAIDKACRSPRGERGLKFEFEKAIEYPDGGRSPRGERGLKYYGLLTFSPKSAVALLAESVD